MNTKYERERERKNKEDAYRRGTQRHYTQTKVRHYDIATGEGDS